jgi:hypothetical protein
MRLGENVRFVNHPNASLIAVRRRTKKLERVEVFEGNFPAIYEETVPVGALRLRRVCHSVRSLRREKTSVLLSSNRQTQWLSWNPWTSG